MKRCLCLCFAWLLLTGAPGCSEDAGSMHNGYYSAADAVFNGDGWKSFITLYIYNNQIVTVEYNARNASGLVLSWDVLSMRRLKARTRIHPSRLIREYTQELLNRQNPDHIRRIAGDDLIYERFTQLAAAAMAQARTGDRRLAEIRLTPGAASR